MSQKDKEVLSAVIRIIDELQSPNTRTIEPHLRLVDDLHLDTDDLSFVFVPELERAFSVSVPPGEWSNVSTVQDAAALVLKYLHKN